MRRRITGEMIPLLDVTFNKLYCPSLQCSHWRGHRRIDPGYSCSARLIKTLPAAYKSSGACVVAINASLDIGYADGSIVTRVALFRLSVKLTSVITPLVGQSGILKITCAVISLRRSGGIHSKYPLIFKVKRPGLFCIVPAPVSVAFIAHTIAVVTMSSPGIIQRKFVAPTIIENSQAAHALIITWSTVVASSFLSVSDCNSDHPLLLEGGVTAEIQLVPSYICQVEAYSKDR